MQVPAEPPWLTGRGHSLIPWTTVRTSGTSSVRAERGSPPIKRACRSTAGTDASFHRTEIKHLHHPVVGKLDLTYEAMNLPADPELTLLVYTAQNQVARPKTGSSCSPAGPPPSRRPMIKLVDLVKRINH
jgi:hypothetical protein